MRTTLYRIKLEIDRLTRSQVLCVQVSFIIGPLKFAMERKSLRELGPRARVRSENLSAKEFPLHSAVTGAMMLIIIFKCR